jgi:hypothetical protein
MLNFISFINVRDYIKCNDNKVCIVKESIRNNINISNKIYNGVRYKRKLNIIDTIDDINIYEIPILENKKLDEETLYWLFSFHINDIIRIIIANKYKIDIDGNLIK